MAFENDENESHLDSTGKISKPRKLNEFKPWHKPRKQWIREKQWWNVFKDVVSTNKYNSTNTIKYFGLPGADLLDVDYISNKMLGTNDLNTKKLFIHGIILSESEHTSANSRLSTLIDRNSVDPASKIEKYDFEGMEGENSVLWKKFEEHGPYHFINLDFCEKIFQERTIGALSKSLEYQFKTQIGKPWVFCVTTKIDIDQNSNDVLTRLDNCLHNIAEDELALFNIEKHFHPVFDAIENKVGILEFAEDFENFSNIYIVGFVIWIVLSALSQGVSFKLKTSAAYNVDSNKPAPDMYSLVFEFKKLVQLEGDLTGVAQYSGINTGKANAESSKEAVIKKLSTTNKIDDLLSGDVELMRRYIAETKSALSNCGWDISKYEEQMC